jgi:hypothetical protein
MENSSERLGAFEKFGVTVFHEAMPYDEAQRIWNPCRESQSIEHPCGCANRSVRLGHADRAELIASRKYDVMSWLLVTGSGAQQEHTRECATMRI